MNIPRPLMILILGFLVVTLAAHAQPVGNVARLGYISGADPQLAASSLEAFRQGRRALGWIEGQNLRIEYRWAHGEFERFPQFAADLVHLKVDVIVASGPAALRALQQATSSIPIVSAVVLEDPVREGLVTSLAHPGGNLTGLASQYEEIVTKQIELLAEAVPKLSESSSCIIGGRTRQPPPPRRPRWRSWPSRRGCSRSARSATSRAR